MTDEALLSDFIARAWEAKRIETQLNDWQKNFLRSMAQMLRRYPRANLTLGRIDVLAQIAGLLEIEFPDFELCRRSGAIAAWGTPRTLADGRKVYDIVPMERELTAEERDRLRRPGAAIGPDRAPGPG